MEKNTNITDEQLIKNFQQGDVHSFDLLVNKYKNRIYNFIYRFVKDVNVAEDEEARNYMVEKSGQMGVPVIEIINESLFISKNKSKSVIILPKFLFKYFFILHLLISIPGLITIKSIDFSSNQNFVKGIFNFFILSLIFLLSSQQYI